jgi:hypothetical protein
MSDAILGILDRKGGPMEKLDHVKAPPSTSYLTVQLLFTLTTSPGPGAVGIRPSAARERRAETKKEPRCIHGVDMVLQLKSSEQ